jgi:uncharacterized protein
MKKFNTLDWLAVVVLVIGGVNWGMIGVFDINLVSALFGEMTVLTRIVYVLVGLSALYVLFTTIYSSTESESEHHRVQHRQHQ